VSACSTSLCENRIESEYLASVLNVLLEDREQLLSACLNSLLGNEIFIKVWCMPACVGLLGFSV
jgi:hypothetical protein